MAAPAAGVPVSPAVARMEVHVDEVLGGNTGEAAGTTSRNVGCRKGGAAPSSRRPAVALGLSLLLKALLWLVGATQYLPLPPYL